MQGTRFEIAVIFFVQLENSANTVYYVWMNAYTFPLSKSLKCYTNIQEMANKFLILILSSDGRI